MTQLSLKLNGDKWGPGLDDFARRIDKSQGPGYTGSVVLKVEVMNGVVRLVEVEETKIYKS